MFPAMGGLVVYVLQQFTDIDTNPLTLPYTVFFCMWSIIFLCSWKRRESEFMFLWGSENAAAIERPLAEFRGVFRVDEETGTEEYVYGNFAARYARSAVSIVVQSACILGTIFCATYATAVQGRKGNWNSWISYQMLGSMMNLFIIQVFGSLYESIADKLTMWQNYRTRTEVGASLAQPSRSRSFLTAACNPPEGLQRHNHHELSLPVHQQLLHLVLRLLHVALPRRRARR